MGYTPYMASELEFFLFKETYAEAHEKGYENLTPTIPYILDYHILATTMDEQYIGPIRRGMHEAGIPIEFSKGEAWYGQHEINTRYADAVTSADRHTIYKNGVKEIAFLNGISATFMAKTSEKDIGSSCHVHSSLVGDDGKSVFVDGEEETDMFRNYLGGLRHRIRDLALFIAPSINSYKRFSAESWAPTSISWGRDNRTCGFRIVGHGQSRRVECRIPGADANPYLAFAALLAAGLDGIENETDPGPELKGNAYEAGKAEAVPVLAARGRRQLGGQRLRPQGLRRGGPQALPELRPDRAAALRRGRHRLRAAADVRARLSPPASSGSAPRSTGSCAGPGRRRRPFIQRTYPAPCSAPAAIALILPPDEAAGEDAGRLARPARRPAAGGRLRRGPCLLRRRAPHPRRPATWPERDRFELALARRGARARDARCSASAAGCSS